LTAPLSAAERIAIGHQRHQVAPFCAVRDGCSRRVIGWALDEYLHTDLVQAAMAVAVALRGELAEQVVLHADRGCPVHLGTARTVRP